MLDPLYGPVTITAEDNPFFLHLFFCKYGLIFLANPQQAYGSYEIQQNLKNLKH